MSLEQSQTDLRASRMAKAARMRHALDIVLPPLFRSARLCDFSSEFRNVLSKRMPFQGLLLWGKPGTGKSHAMAAILRHSVLTGITCRRISYEMLCLSVRSAYRPGSTSTELDIIKPLIEVDYLFIEDLGTTVGGAKAESDFSVRTLLAIVDSRIEQCRPTFVTSNKPLEIIGKSFDDRIESRLNTFKIIEMSGRDKRKGSY